MLGHSHMVIGIASWTAVGAYVGYTIDLPSVFCAAVGALFPDIDHPRSTINRMFKPLKVLGKWVPHRGPTHSLLFIVCVTSLLLWIDSTYTDIHFQHWLLAFWVGCISHLVTDWMTRGGIPIFWPLPNRFSMPGSFLTGSWKEKFCVYLAITGMVVYFTRSYEHPLVVQSLDYIMNIISLAFSKIKGMIP